VAGHGRIVARFFDAVQSRTLAWARRPQAAALVAGLADPDRGWDAVVIGEYERAFCWSQYTSMAPLFEHYGIQLCRRTCTSVRIRSFPAWLPWPSCTRVMTMLCAAERRAAPGSRRPLRPRP